MPNAVVCIDTMCVCVCLKPAKNNNIAFPFGRCRKNPEFAGQIRAVQPASKHTLMNLLRTACGKPEVHGPVGALCEEDGVALKGEVAGAEGFQKGVTSMTWTWRDGRRGALFLALSEGELDNKLQDELNIEFRGEAVVRSTATRSHMFNGATNIEFLHTAGRDHILQGR